MPTPSTHVLVTGSGHQSVDARGCSTLATPRLMSASTRRAVAHHCWGLDAPPTDATRACTCLTSGTGLVPRQPLQQRWAGATLPASYGEPPLATGTSSSSTPWHGCRCGRPESIGRPHIQHLAPGPSTLALSLRRLCPLAYLGLVLEHMRRATPPHMPGLSNGQRREGPAARGLPSDGPGPRPARRAGLTAPAARRTPRLHSPTFLCAPPRTTAHDRAARPDRDSEIYRDNPLHSIGVVL